METVNIKKVEDGISKYVDTVLLADMPKNDIKTFAIGVGIAIKLRTALPTWLNMLGIVDQEGNVNVEIAREEAKKRIPEDGMILDVDKIGKTFVFEKEDIDKLYQFITE